LANDFLTILADLGELVSLEVNSETYDNISGDRSNSYAAGTNITVVLGWPDPKYDYDVGGQVDKIDRIMYSKQSDAVAKGDRITDSGGNKYEVYDVSDSSISISNTDFSCRRSRLIYLE